MEMLFPAYQRMRPEDIYADLSFPSVADDRPYTAINMVTTVDGKASLGGRAFRLGSDVDHLVMRRIRAAADGVMVGAETLRRENVNPGVPATIQASRTAQGLAPQPTAIVVSSTLDLPLDRTFFSSSAFQRVVVTTQSAPPDRVSAVASRARVVRAGVDRVELPLMMRILRVDVGIRSLLVEGGPTLNSGLIAERLVDELLWTVAPKIIGGAAMRTMVEGHPLSLDRIPLLRLVSLHRHEDELFLRYRLP